MKSAIAIGHQLWLSLFYVVIFAAYAVWLYGYLPHYSDHCFTIQRTHAYKSFAYFALCLRLKPISLPWTYSTESAYWHQLCCTVRVCCCCLADTADGDEARLWKKKNNLFRLVCRYYFSTLIITLLLAYKKITWKLMFEQQQQHKHKR